MAAALNLQTVLDGLHGLTKDELKQVEEYISSLRASLLPNRQLSPAASRKYGAPFRPTKVSKTTSHFSQAPAWTPSTSPLLKLPTEVRYMIYELLVTPEMAEGHVVKNRIPYLFNICREMRHDFAGFYYGTKVFKVELFNPESSSWEEVKTPKMVQATFEAWDGSFVRDFPGPVAWHKQHVEISHDDTFNQFLKRGVLTWTGGPKADGVSYTFASYGYAKHDEESGKVHSRRMKELSEWQKKFDKLNRLSALLRSTP